MTFLAVVLAVTAALLWWPPARRRRLRATFNRHEAAGPSRSPSRSTGSVSLADPRTRRLAAAVAGLGVAVVWGGLVGWGLGLALAVGGPIVLGRFESTAERRRREAQHRQSADAADLLAACLASGASVTTSLSAVSRALGEPIRSSLDGLLAATALGADQRSAWRELAAQPGLSALGRAIGGSIDTGAPLVQVLPGVADDLRRQARAQVESAARAAGVKAVAPLAACFLPAFLLVGIVPIVASLALPFFTQM